MQTEIRLSTLFLSAVAVLVMPQQAQAQSDDLTRAVVFTGEVAYRIDDTVQVRNPDGSMTSFDASAFGPTGPATGDPVSITYTYAANDPAFSNAACGGRYALTTVAAAGGCSVGTTVRIDGGATLLGGLGFGSTGGDNPPFISGMFLRVDPVTGATSIDLPTGEYRLGYAAVPNYQYDSASRTLTGVGDPCVSAFSCYEDVLTGTLDRFSLPLAITGDYGKIRPGFDVGYRAGTAGFLDVLGSFSFSGGSSGGGSTPVPEPGSSLLFALGLGALVARRKRKIA